MKTMLPKQRNVPWTVPFPHQRCLLSSSKIIDSSRWCTRSAENRMNRPSGQCTPAQKHGPDKELLILDASLPHPIRKVRSIGFCRMLQARHMPCRDSGGRSGKKAKHDCKIYPKRHFCPFLDYACPMRRAPDHGCRIRASIRVPSSCRPKERAWPGLKRGRLDRRPP
jgi:hypothetical protein